jgi:DNA adenine methylase
MSSQDPLHLDPELQDPVEPEDSSPATTTRKGDTRPRATSGPIKPFLKWAGGKTRLLKRLHPHFPDGFSRYHEPFLGGGAVFFAIGDRASEGARLSDLNDELMNTWRVVRDHGAALQPHLDAYKEEDSEEFYYELRSHEPRDAIERACRFIYLNQTAWNGLWRVNRKGEFNVPWGQRPFRGLTRTELEGLSLRLEGTGITTQDFRQALSSVEQGDFVYLDPPYLPLSDTSKFFFYTEKRFREPDLRDLAELCRELTAVGASWVLSNRDTPLVRELFSHARIVGLTARRSVAAQNKKNVEAKNSPEVIIAGGS